LHNPREKRGPVTRRRARLPLAALVLATLLTQSCASLPEPEKSGPVANFDDANLYFAQGKYDAAQRYYTKILDEAPDSPYRVHALLGSADSYYMQGDYIVSAPLYARFVELYPLDDRTPDALFYGGMSYFKDMVKVTKDQGSTRKALDLFVKFSEKYPGNPAEPFAKEKISFLTDRLAEKMFTVAKFYFDLNAYGSCVGRVDDLLEKYPDTRFKGEALVMKAKSYAGEEAYEKAKKTYERIVSELSGTEFAKRAQSELNALNNLRRPG
jgi:outer membrane protein assembly factor BamD